jgi:hypothetical protein
MYKVIENEQVFQGIRAAGGLLLGNILKIAGERHAV